MLNGCQIFLAGSKGLIKPVSGPESVFAHFHSKPFRCRGARSGPNLSGRRQATPYDASLTTLGFGVSGSTGFCRRNLEIWGLSAANVSHIVQNDPVPLKRLILEPTIELSAHVLEQPTAVVGCCGGSLWPQMACMSLPWARAFWTPVEGARLGGQRRLSP